MPRSSASIKDNPTVDKPKEDKTKAELRQEALEGVAQIGQFIAVALGQFADAGAIGMHAPNMIDETVKLAENNSKVASKVDLLIELGPYAGILAAGIPFLAQLFVNHGVFKAEQFANAGVASPEVLEMRMKTQLMKQAMDAQMEQQRIEEEMREMAAQFDSASQNGHNPEND